MAGCRIFSLLVTRQKEEERALMFSVVLYWLCNLDDCLVIRCIFLKLSWVCVIFVEAASCNAVSASHF